MIPGEFWMVLLLLTPLYLNLLYTYAWVKLVLRTYADLILSLELLLCCPICYVLYWKDFEIKIQLADQNLNLWSLTKIL